MARGAIHALSADLPGRATGCAGSDLYKRSVSQRGQHGRRLIYLDAQRVDGLFDGSRIGSLRIVGQEVLKRNEEGIVERKQASVFVGRSEVIVFDVLKGPHIY